MIPDEYQRIEYVYNPGGALFTIEEYYQNNISNNDIYIKVTQPIDRVDESSSHYTLRPIIRFWAGGNNTPTVINYIAYYGNIFWGGLGLEYAYNRKIKIPTYNNYERSKWWDYDLRPNYTKVGGLCQCIFYDINLDYDGDEYFEYQLKPVIHKETGKVGYYDIIHNKFITSETDVEFIYPYTAE